MDDCHTINLSETVEGNWIHEMHLTLINSLNTRNNNIGHYVPSIYWHNPGPHCDEMIENDMTIKEAPALAISPTYIANADTNCRKHALHDADQNEEHPEYNHPGKDLSDTIKNPLTKNIAGTVSWEGPNKRVKVGSIAPVSPEYCNPMSIDITIGIFG